jgi:SAM-dependent methyltransferase
MEREVQVDGLERQPATDRLLARLDDEVVAAVKATFDESFTELWNASPPEYHPYLTLGAGVWGRVPGVIERTGLTPDEPPPEIHAMARGPIAAGGDYFSADLVIEGLERAGGDPGALRRALDFGCSSGRTVRTLAAAYPEVAWHGVDPNREAIGWASEHLPGAHFAVSDSDPPLPFADAFFDLVYAISIWSHFGEDSARAWLAEMHRVVAPGGHLVLTVHGAHAVAYYGTRGERPAEQLNDVGRALERRGFWYRAEFGEAGDFGVVHPQWGTAFMSGEWLLRAATPAWHVCSYAVGRNAGNQDVVVLRRAR